MWTNDLFEPWNWYAIAIEVGAVSALAIDANGTIFAGTDYKGGTIYRSTDPANFWKPVEAGLPPAEYGPPPAPPAAAMFTIL